MTEEGKKKAMETFNALIEEARKNNVNMTMDEIKKRFGSQGLNESKERKKRQSANSALPFL